MLYWAFWHLDVWWWIVLKLTGLQRRSANPFSYSIGQRTNPIRSSRRTHERKHALF